MHRTIVLDAAPAVIDGLRGPALEKEAEAIVAAAAEKRVHVVGLSILSGSHMPLVRDVLCAHGHAAWSGFTMQAARTATLEVTAVDESGLATTAKAMPLIGVWAASDAIGTLPTLAATPSAFNTMALGSTAAGVATTQAEGLRFAIADARGSFGRKELGHRRLARHALRARVLRPGRTID